MPLPLRAGPLVAACGALAAATLLLPGAPTYDPWAWLLWGRELWTLEVSTAEGPAWKPLTVLLAAPLTLSGAAAPDLWLWLARAGALAGVGLAARVAWRLGGGSWLAAGAAALGVGLAGGYAWGAAQGASEGLLVALGLAAWERALAGRHRAALGWAALAALVRVEVWPFLGVYALWRAGGRPRALGALGLAGLAILALWFVPEWLSSGDPLRSSSRARVPNPGQPALAGLPALASLRTTLELPLLPLALCAPLGLLAATRTDRRRAVLPSLAGAAWLALVAVMAQAGFSGEARYALPGVALLAVGGGAGLGRLVALRPGATRPPVVRVPALAAGVVLAATVLVAAGRVQGLLEATPRLAHAARVVDDLDDAVRVAGGREAVLGCGRPAVGAYRGPLLAWALEVPKQRVDFTVGEDSVVFRSRLRPGGPVSPPPPPAVRTQVRAGEWTVLAPCDLPVREPL